MESERTSCERGRDRSFGSKGPHRRRHHGRFGRHGSSSKERSREPWRKFIKDKGEKGGRGEIKLAVATLCQDMKPFHQDVIACLIKDNLRGKPRCERPPKEERRGRRHSKERGCCSAERVKEVAKEILKNKDKVIEAIDMVMEVLNEQRMHKVEEAKKGEEERFHHGHRRFAKQVARLISIMWHKGITSKEEQKEMIQKFFEKMKRGHMKGMMKGAERIVEKILFYELEDRDPAYRKAIEHVVTDAFVSHAALKMAVKHKEMSEMKEEEKTEKGEKPEFEHHGRGMHRHHWGRFMKGDRRGGRDMFRGFMLKKGIDFVLCYYRKNQENIKACFEAVKGVVEEHFKESKDCRKKCKTAAKIISEAMKISGEEKKTNDFYVDFAKKCIKGFVTPCHKGCEKRCQHLVRMAMLFNGVKDKCVLGVGSHWGAIACCQANGKTGCSEEVCAEFIKKWIADHVPIVTEAVAVANEMAKEFTESPIACGRGEKFICKLTLKYLALNCTDGKFNKDDFKKFLKECKERMDKKLECIKKECVPK